MDIIGIMVMVYGLMQGSMLLFILGMIMFFMAD